MADYVALCEALASNLATIDGLQESAYLLSNPTPPAAEVQVGETEYDKAMHRGLDTVMLTVRVFVAFASDIGAQKRLRAMLATDGTASVKAAIESDRTLGGQAEDLRVTKCTGERGFLREIGGGTSGRGSTQGALLGAEWTVEVLL
jgi:hypothetical protein